MHHAPQCVAYPLAGSLPLTSSYLATGLGFGFKTFKWVSTIPPILIVLAFKVYLHRAFQTSFRFYLPTAQELQEAQVHSRRGDAAGNRLERRFGHPALNSDLFTPMVHANMTALLPQVYSGKIQNVQTKLDEMGGQKTDAQVVAGGIKIAAVEEVCCDYCAPLRSKLTMIPSATLNTIPRSTGVIVGTIGTHVLCLRPTCWQTPKCHTRRAAAAHLRHPNLRATTGISRRVRSPRLR